MTETEPALEHDTEDLAAAVRALAQSVDAMRGELRDALQDADVRRAITRTEARLRSRLDDVTQIVQTLKADVAAYSADRQ